MGAKVPILRQITVVGAVVAQVVQDQTEVALVVAMEDLLHLQPLPVQPFITQGVVVALQVMEVQGVGEAVLHQTIRVVLAMAALVPQTLLGVRGPQIQVVAVVVATTAQPLL